ncbi:hypothetical protein IC235_00365 [Hymenobacter sp. BT664]|uniref:Uncharacterized protein n=1 Tax=Hymenobacter montanus TaxID=2771359 RepID=A0A927B917_9BACT|nr:hypothetical protein [Hymenobacter montanus]MBD2766341.1 hypothetical protein [Hymenobacter montanus]
MKLPKTLLGAILVGITVQATGCKQATSYKKESPVPKVEGKDGKEVVADKDSAEYITNNCPACGMG